VNRLLLAAALGALLGTALPAQAQAWSSLTPAQQQALAPLKSDWASIDEPRRQKWLDVAARFPKMPPDERRRVQERMAAWSALTPTERARARLQFQETRQIAPEERQARWQAYQALPDDERKRLAQQAKPANGKAAAPRASDKADGAKRNVVAATPAPPVRPVAPTVVQAKPGATTTTMSTKAAPPPHHQPGLPKIVATPNFVDPATLLPKRGPQGAAVRRAASSDPTQQP